LVEVEAVAFTTTAPLLRLVMVDSVEAAVAEKPDKVRVV
jgi:hypothetical protein